MRAFVCILGVMLASCSVNREFARTAHDLARPLMEDYVELLEKKSGYDEDTVRIRRQGAQKLLELLREGSK